MASIAKKVGRVALVVKSVEIDETEEEQVKIVARKSGFVAWLLTALGINPTFTLRIYADRIESEEGSLSGHLKTLIPMTSVDSCISGFTKPVGDLFIGIILLVFSILVQPGRSSNGFLSLTSGLICIGIVSIVRYFLEKCLMLTFSTKGGNVILFPFKRSVVGGVSVDEALADRIAEIVKRNCIDQNAKNTK